MTRIHGILVCASLALAACGGAGGGGGGGGKPPGDDTPEWGEWSLEPLFEQEGFGEITRLAGGHFGPGGEKAIVTAGRQLAVRREGDMAPLWSQTWTRPGDTVSLDVATGLTVIDVNGDGIDDVLVSNSARDTFAYDGRDGSPLWHLALGERDGTAHTVTYGDPGDPVFISSMGPTGFRVATGTPAWRLNLAKQVWFVHKALRGPDQPTALYLGIGETPQGHPDAYAIDGNGNVLFSVDSGSFLTAVGGADLDGSHRHSMLLATPNGILRALGPDAEERWEIRFDIGGDPFLTYVETILPLDVDGDGRDELLLSVTQHYRPELTHLVLVSSTGEELARTHVGETVPELATVGAGAETRVLAQIGPPIFGIPGTVALLEPGSLDEVWTTTLPLFITGVQTIETAAPGELLVSSIDGRLRRLSLRDGHAAGEEYLGFFQAPGITLTDSYIVTGDALGTISAHSRDGTRAWLWSFPFAGAGSMVDLRSFEAGGSRRVVALASDDQSTSRHALLQVLSEEGEELWALPSPMGPRALATGNGLGGEALIAVGLADPYNTYCEVQLLAGETGERRWATRLPRCLGLYMAFEDVDGDGEAEILAAGWSINDMPFVALLDHDGEVLFSRSITTVPYWVAARGDALFLGGAGKDGSGYVARLDTGGSPVWEASLPPVTDSADPRKRLPGDSLYGTLITDSGRVSGVAATTMGGQLHLLNGGKGSLQWTVDVHGQEPASERIQGGAVAFVPPNDLSPGFLVVSQERQDAAPGRLFTVDGEGGVLSSSLLRGSCRGLATSSTGSTPWMGIATTRGVAGFEVRSGEPNP